MYDLRYYDGHLHSMFFLNDVEYNKLLERPQSRPHWLLLIYCFQFRSAARATPARRPSVQRQPRARPLRPRPLPSLTDNLVVLIIV